MYFWKYWKYIVSRRSCRHLKSFSKFTSMTITKLSDQWKIVNLQTPRLMLMSTLNKLFAALTLLLFLASTKMLRAAKSCRIGARDGHVTFWNSLACNIFAQLLAQWWHKLVYAYTACVIGCSLSFCASTHSMYESFLGKVVHSTRHVSCHAQQQRLQLSTWSVVLTACVSKKNKSLYIEFNIKGKKMQHIKIGSWSWLM